MFLPPPPRLMAQHLTVGALQGVLATFLYYARAQAFWPATAAPELLHLLVLCVGVLPWAFYLSSGVGLPRARRLALLAVIMLGCAGLGAYSGWLEAGNTTLAGREIGSASGEQTNMPPPDLSPTVIQALAALAITFLLVPLVAAWQPAGEGQGIGRWSYRLLFEIAWRNALLVPVALALTGLCWGVLWAGAGLLAVIGLGGTVAFLQWPAVFFGISTLGLSVAFAQGILRAELLLNLRRFVLSLNAGLLPLLLGFGVAWVIALPFTGLQRLFDTGHAAFMLLGFLVMAIVFLNAAWQDGHEPVPYNPRLARAVAWASLTLPVIAGVALWALALRVQQYGWTEQRIWAFMAAVLSAGYAVGYALSLFPLSLWPSSEGPRRSAPGWMPSLGSTNVVLALALLGCISVLASPVADPRRLAVADQVQRLLDRDVSPETFDYGYLAHRPGRWGQNALQSLAALDGEDWQRAIARQASDLLKGDTEGAANAPSLLDVRSRLTTLADTPMPDEAFLQRFLSPSIGWQEQMCWSSDAHCAVYQQDLNADGLKEMLLIVQSEGSAAVHVYSRQNGPWQYVAYYPMSSAPWVKAILDQTLRIKRQGWPELDVGGESVTPMPAY